MALVFKERSLDSAELVEGDQFNIVLFAPYGAGVQATSRCTVERILKRDIVCKKSNGDEVRFNKSLSIPHCYALDDPAFLTIRDEVRTKNRVMQIAYRLRGIKATDIASDEVFMVAAEAFFTRLDVASN